MNVSSRPAQPSISTPTAGNRRSPSPNGRREWGAVASRNILSPSQKAQEQDAAVLQSLWGEDVKIRQGKALLKPSEIRNRTPGRAKLKDWGECPLTFDKIREPVRAADGKVHTAARPARHDRPVGRTAIFGATTAIRGSFPA